MNQLDDNLAHGKSRSSIPPLGPGSWPASASGDGWHEAPRGSLGHWVEIGGKSIKNYQAVVPTTWNAGPRDPQGQRGAYEASLLNTPVADPDRPLEILRTIHSFDPCIACAVHVIDAKGRDIHSSVPEGRLGRLPCMRTEGNVDTRPRSGPSHAVYVWQYPLRLVHWGLVISIGVLSFTGYYIHDPFIIGQMQHPFMMGWFRFVHEAFGMFFLALFLLRLYLFFAGDRWVRWRLLVPLKQRPVQGNVGGDEVLLPSCVPRLFRRSGTTRWRRFPTSAFTMVLVEIVTGLVMYNGCLTPRFSGPLVGWIPRLISIQNLRLIHFFLMYVFIAFGIFHVHLCLLVSRAEKRGLMDSIFTGYKVIPVDEIEEDDRAAIEATLGKR